MSASDQPMTVEVVAYAPTAFYHCMHCEVVWQETGFSRGVHEEQVASGLPDDLLADYRSLSAWVQHLLQTYCDQVSIKVIDAASLEGLWKTVRHGLRRYPAVMVGGRAHTGTGALAAAEAEIARRLGAQVQQPGSV